MIALREIKESLLHLIFPHICPGCGNDLHNGKNILCIRCIDSLPETKFESSTDNPIEKIFWGRLKIESASAQFYFTKESLVQRLMHQFKYKRDKEIGLQLGKMMGQQLLKSGRFEVDALIPLPLFPSKERQRGYNQARVLCEGISTFLPVPILDGVVLRPQFTETQTRKNRIERWRNIEGKFVVSNPGPIRNKHILLVDDVITTGATLESCGLELLKVENLRLSVATLCIASR